MDWPAPTDWCSLSGNLWTTDVFFLASQWINNISHDWALHCFLIFVLTSFLRCCWYPQVQEMLVARKTRTREALTLMWCVGQLPEKNLSQGLRGNLCCFKNLSQGQRGDLHVVIYCVHRTHNDLLFSVSELKVKGCFFPIILICFIHLTGKFTVLWFAKIKQTIPQLLLETCFY